jgi:hypothetical protein
VSAASSLSSPILFPLPASDPAAPGDLRRSRALAGWDARPARLARTPRGRCAHARESNLARGRISSFAPSLRAPLRLGWREGSRHRLSRPAGLSQGSLGLSPLRSRHRASNAGRGRNPSAQATNPHWGFPSYSSDHTVSEREQTRRRRVEPREGAVAPGRCRRAKDDDFNRRSREGEEAVRVGRRSRTGAGTSTPP